MKKNLVENLLKYLLMPMSPMKRRLPKIFSDMTIIIDDLEKEFKKIPI